MSGVSSPPDLNEIVKPLVEGVLFDHEQRLRKVEGKPDAKPEEFTAAVAVKR